MTLKNQKNNNMKKIIGVYKITNTVTGDFYIGSSKDVKNRWAHHKCHSTWKNRSNNQMYHDMRKYGVDKFELQILEEVEIDRLKEAEQKFIEKMHPIYNSNRANGWDIEKWKEYLKEYKKSDKYKEYLKEYNNQLCQYNGKKITLHALCERFRRAGVEHPTIEAKRYLIKKEPENVIEFYDVYP